MKRKEELYYSFGEAIAEYFRKCGEEKEVITNTELATEITNVIDIIGLSLGNVIAMFYFGMLGKKYEEINWKLFDEGIVKGLLERTIKIAEEQVKDKRAVYFNEAEINEMNVKKIVDEFVKKYGVETEGGEDGQRKNDNRTNEGEKSGSDTADSGNS